MSSRDEILAESDELLQRMARGNGKAHDDATSEPDLHRIIHGLQLELSNMAAKLSALHYHHNELVKTLNREFKEKNLSARLGQLEKHHENLVERVAVVEQGKFAGTYSRASEYSKGTSVVFEGSSWIAINDVKVNEVPGKHPSWHLTARCGKDGKDALTGDADASTRRLPTRHGSTGLR